MTGRQRKARQRRVFGDGVELAVETVGQGAPVLLHPSVGRSARDFDDLAGRLARAGFTAVMFHPRGVLQSRGPLNDLTLHDLGQDLWTVADALDMPRIHLVGHAFGNRVVRCAAEDHPERALSVTLLAAGGQVPGRPRAIRALEQVFQGSLNTADHLAAVRTAFFAPGNDPSGWRDGWYSGAAVAQGAAGARTPAAQWQGGGAAPLLIVQGESDEVAPVENGRQLQRLRPGSQLVEIAGAGHALLPERPEAVGTAVVDFLTRVASRQDWNSVEGSR